MTLNRAAFYILTLVASVSCTPSFAQVFLTDETAEAQPDFCECCSHASLQYVIDFDDRFPPKAILKEKVKEVMVYTRGYINAPVAKGSKTIKVRKADIPEYREAKFKFDKYGRVSIRIHYNRLGKPHSIYEYERNSAGKITRETFNYLDSLERKSFSGSRITDNTYDDKNLLVKSKNRDYNGKILPDSLSVYSTFDYDNKDRPIKRIREFNYSFSTRTTYTTIFKYDDKKLSSSYKTTNNGELWLTGEITYNKSWKTLNKKSYDVSAKASSFEYLYEFDSQGYLKTYELKAGNGGSECPDGANYIDVYTRSPNGLIEGITHTYEGHTCQMRVEYKK